MDERRFDGLAKAMAGGVSRRTLLVGLVAGLLGGSRRTGVAAQVSQAQCGNKRCKNNPGKCTDGCVCCVYGNGNNRCLPAGSCGPCMAVCPPESPVFDPVRGCVAPAATTTPAPPITTTATPATTTAVPVTTTSAPTTTAAPTTTMPPTTTLAPTTTLPPLGGAGNGTPCSLGSQCASGFCTDGVCCVEAACRASCLSCNVASRAGTCTSTCPGAGECMDPGFCSGRDGGVCGDPVPKTNGIAWGDFSSNPCAEDRGTCKAGTCQPAPVTCAPIDACHEPGTCNLTTGACEVGPPKTCPASGQCYEGFCDPTTGLCSERPKFNGSLCVHENKCATLSNCRDGSCSISMSTGCGTANTDCTRGEGTCNPDTGDCEYAHEPNGTPCSTGLGDSSNCNSCQGGVCTPFADGTLCTGSTCTTCDGGTCVVMPPAGKRAGDSCFVDSDCCSNNCDFFVCAGNFEGDTCGEYNFCARNSDCCFGFNMFCHFNRCRSIS